MILTRPVSCVYDTISAYHFTVKPIYCNCYPWMNYIFLMMIPTMMGQDPVPLVRALFHFALAIMLVMSVDWDLVFNTDWNRVNR